MTATSRLRRSLLLPVTLGTLVFITSSHVMSLFGSQKPATISQNGYITTKFDHAMTGRLGNYLFEFISLIGIADTVGRIPYIYGNRGFLRSDIWKRIATQFPQLVEEFTIVEIKVADKEVFFHGAKCCIWEDPERLKNETDAYIRLHGDYFQSYKYFDHMRADIRKWLLPNQTVQDRVQSRFPPALKDHFLVCVHIRREDFVYNKQKDPSNATFSVDALKYIFKKHSSSNKQMGAVILGNAVSWEKETFGDIPNVYIVEGSTPEEDFALSRMYCDTVLITAPSSTFGFWLGYLSKGFLAYYRDIKDTHDITKKEMKSDDFFLPNWVKIKEKNGTIVEVITEAD